MNNKWHLLTVRKNDHIAGIVVEESGWYLCKGTIVDTSKLYTRKKQAIAAKDRMNKEKEILIEMETNDFDYDPMTGRMSGGNISIGNTIPKKK